MEKLTEKNRALAAGYARTAAGIARMVAAAWFMLRLLDDLRGAAYQTLTHAAGRYDPRLARPEDDEEKAFAKYAWYRVTGGVIDAARNERRWLARHACLDAVEDVQDQGRPATAGEAAVRLDQAAADVMAAFAAACRAAEQREGAAVALEREEDRSALERALAALDPEDRLLFLLRHHDELTWAAVASALEISLTTAKDRDRRIRAELRKALRGWVDG